MMEKTSKRIKKKMAISYIVFAVGLFMFLLGILLHMRLGIIIPMLTLSGMVGTIVGIIMIIISTIKRWWNHG